MAQILISRETFDGGGTLDSGTHGGFSAIPTGSMRKHRLGYYTTGTGASPGRSGVSKDSDLEAYFTQSISGNNIYSLHCAVRFRSFATGGAGASSLFMRALGNTFADAITVGIQADGHMAVWDASAGLTQLGEILSLNTWYYFTFTVQHKGDNSTTYRIHRKALGGALTLIYDKGASVFLGFTSIERLQICNKIFGGTTRWRGHFSVTGLYSEALFTDVAFPSDLNEPPTAALTWYTTNTGQVNGDGSQSDPWFNEVNFLNNEFAYGLFEQAGGYAVGDTVYIDTNDGAFNLHTSSATAVSLNISCRGINVLPAPGQTFWTVTSYSNFGLWTQDGTNANLWFWTGSYGSEVVDGCCVWENNINPSKISRSSYGSEALAMADMNNKPSGEFWWYPNVAGDKVYIKPSGNGNPNSNGKLYEQATNIGGVGAACIIVSALDVNIEGPKVTKTCLAKSSAIAGSDGDPVDGTCLTFDIGSGGTYRLARPFFDKWAKHAYKIVHSSSSSVFTEVSVPLGNGSAYCNFGGQTGVAYFNGNVAAVNNTITSNNLTQSTNAMLPQSAGGTIQTAYPSVIVHNPGSGSQFSNITLNSPILCSSVIKQAAATAMVINAGRIALLNNTFGTMTINSRSWIGGGISGFGITINPGCAIVMAENLTAANTNVQISGVLSIIGCTIDASACIVGDATASIFYRTAAATITLGANAWKFGGKDIAIVANAATGEITANDNWYEKPVGNRLYETYNALDRTGTQWQGLGFDVNGGFVSDLKLNAQTYKPRADSPLKGVASIARWPTLANSSDLFGTARPAAGNTEAGAVVVDTGTSAQNMLMTLEDMI